VELRIIQEMKFLRNNPFVLITTSLAVPILATIFFTNLDLFDSGLREILHIEDNEWDEFGSAVLLIVIGLAIDRLRARQVAKRQSEIDAQRLRVLQATMRTVHDLVNNFLNNLQLFRLEAEDGPLSLESLKFFDDLIYETAEKLKALGDSESAVEYEMASGVGILTHDRG
jgi:hypothetical protein